MKKKNYLGILSLVCLSFLTLNSCRPKDEPQNKGGENNTTIVGDKDFFVLPIDQFGATKETISHLETQRGAKIDESNVNPFTLVAKAELNGEKSTITYFFEDGKYSYAVGQWHSPKGIEEFVKSIKKQELGFEEDSKLAAVDEKLFISKKGKNPIVLSLTTKKNEAGEVGSYTFGPQNETFFSAMRTSNLTEGDLFLPLVCKDVPQTLMYRYEARFSHALDEANSKPNKGIFTFIVEENPFIKNVKYWFDEKTQSKLEESAILFDKANLPKIETIETLLTKCGFVKTPLSVPNSKTIIYYCKAMKSAAFLDLMPAKPNPNFKPSLQFVFRDFTNELPKEEVDFPMPLLEFNKKPLSEVIESYYKKQPWFKGVEVVPGIGAKIKTSSKDFDTMVVMSMDGDMKSNYVATTSIAADQRTIMSPLLLKMLRDKGFVEVEGPAIPTYENKDLGLQCQMDVNAVLVENMFTISFNPIGL